jgi:hypothetical protein
MISWIDGYWEWMDAFLNGELCEAPAEVYMQDYYAKGFYNWCDFDPKLDISADRLLYDRALEMLRSAAINEILGMIFQDADLLYRFDENAECYFVGPR